jgi:hypothetical protein
MNAYTISTYAFEKMDQVLLKSMLQLVQKQLNAVWDLENIAKIILVDIEQPVGKDFWDSYHLDAEKIMIAYAKQKIDEAEWFLQKPIRVQSLVNLLNTIAAKINTQSLQSHSMTEKPVAKPTLSSSQTTAPITTAAPEPTETQITIEFSDNYLFQPTKYLLGLLQTAIQIGQAQRLSCAGLPPLYLLPQEQLCFTKALNMSRLDSSQKILYGAFAEHIDHVNLSEAELKQEVAYQQLSSYPIETILWLATLYASHGRLITESAKKNMIKLKQWPNFIVLPHDPKHIHLAAFMLKHTADLATIAIQTRVSLPMVIDFFNACQIIGLIIEKPVAKPGVKKKLLPEQKRQLFKGILHKLLKY